MSSDHINISGNDTYITWTQLIEKLDHHQQALNRINAFLSKVLTVEEPKVEVDHNVDQLSEEMKKCSTILQILMNHQDASIFNEPIDHVKLQLPNYHLFIKNPMDLGTINERIKIHYYSNHEDFARDVRLTFLNVMTYNSNNHYVYQIALTLSRLFEEHWKEELFEKNITRKG